MRAARVLTTRCAPSQTGCRRLSAPAWRRPTATWTSCARLLCSRHALRLAAQPQAANLSALQVGLPTGLLGGGHQRLGPPAPDCSAQGMPSGLLRSHKLPVYLRYRLGFQEACLEAATSDLDLLRQTALLKAHAPSLLRSHKLPLLASLLTRLFARGGCQCIGPRTAQSAQHSYQRSLHAEQGADCSFFLDVLSAAGLTSTPAVQAAIYGRAFCGADALPRMAIREAAQRLRLLNAMRRCGALALSACNGSQPSSSLHCWKAILQGCAAASNWGRRGLSADD